MSETQTTPPPPVEVEMTRLRAGIDENNLESSTLPKPALSKRRIPTWLSVVIVGCLLVVMLGGFMFTFGGDLLTAQPGGGLVARFNGTETSQLDNTPQENQILHAMPTLQPILAPEATPWPTPPIADSP
ncbi:MAG: hypothetical protein KC433_15235 [Anaerolineales bacterium]|nr:hypothetical protein [Anaerolineales bacterium]MCB8937143.1 hypothetical protein [Ardenticatenaceae bacterium]